MSNRRLVCRVLLLSVLLLGAGSLLRAQDREPTDRVDSTLRMLYLLRSSGVVPETLQAVLEPPLVPVTIRFQNAALALAPEKNRWIEELGAQLRADDQGAVVLGEVVSVEIPWQSLDRLADWPDVERVDSLWKPARASPLDVSVHEIGADLVWSQPDPGGRGITGEGVTVASFDTGIDVFHPDFWRDDGGEYAWLDANGNQTLDPGIDAVDMNADGAFDAGELLRLLDSASPPGQGVPGTNDGIFRPDVDWLYRDRNGNGRRDYGLAAGFTDSDATLGEMLFLGRDTDLDGVIGISETIVALGGSKIKAVLGPGETEYRRGSSLIHAPADDSGHGTQAASVVAGGQVGVHRYTGVAPGVDLLLADCYDNDPSAYIPWAEQNGANVMLYEFGSWVQEFLDGSSNLEKMLDAESAKGIVQVAPTGNLADGAKHAHLVLGTAGAHQVRFVAPFGQQTHEVWISILWHRWDAALTVELLSPAGTAVALPGDDTVTRVDGHIVLSSRDRSERDTVRFDIGLFGDGSTVTEGVWTLRLTNRLSYGLNVNLYLTDQDRDWEGGVIFLDSVDGFYTVTSPATADSAISVTSYSSRGRGGDPVGVRSAFSGVGPRLDGEDAVDVAAPGHYADVACAGSGSADGAGPGEYRWFGGTSAAAAHAAGAVALLRQAHPYLNPSGVGDWLRETARADVQTGIVPNERWGYGKLNVALALEAIPTPTATPVARMMLPVIIRSRAP